MAKDYNVRYEEMKNSRRLRSLFTLCQCNKCFNGSGVHSPIRLIYLQS